MDKQEEANRARSLALAGVPKSLEHRAAMHASRMVFLRRWPSRDWQLLYIDRLRELKEQQKVLNLLPALIV